MNGKPASTDEGATAVEYALMLAFIFAAIVGTVTTLGLTLAGIFANATALI